MVFITRSGFKTEKYICVLMSVEKKNRYTLFGFVRSMKKIIIYMFLCTNILKSEHL